MKLITVATVGAVMLVGACTTTPKVAVMQPGDRAMTCTGLRTEFAKLDQIKAQGEHNQGVNGANVAAAILLPMAIAGNYLTARDAMQLAEQRRTYLMSFYNEKNCDNPANADLQFMVPAAALTPAVNTARGMH